MDKLSLLALIDHARKEKARILRFLHMRYDKNVNTLTCHKRWLIIVF